MNLYQPNLNLKHRVDVLSTSNYQYKIVMLKENVQKLHKRKRA